MHHWYHVDCLLAALRTQRATSKSIGSLDDIGGWSELGDLDREAILEKLQAVESFRADQHIDGQPPAGNSV